MTLRVVAIPLIAAICLGSPASASTSTDDEQQVKGRGARDRGASSGGGSTAGATRGGGSGENRGSSGENRGGDRTADRTAQRRDDGGQRTTTASSGDRDADPQRYAVPRDPNQSGYRDSGRRNNAPVIVNRNRPATHVYYGSSYRGPRYYAPVYYDSWARHYYRWSPIGYAPWSLIYGTIGYSNFGFYGGVGPNPFYGTYGYGYGGNYGYGPYSPWQVSGYDIGSVRLKIKPRDAQVFVDGNYAGLVDDFDGTFQSLRLEQGGHKIEIHMPGFEDLELDVHVQPGRTLTLSEQLRPRP
jgi:hypothetical protein